MQKIIIAINPLMPTPRILTSVTEGICPVNVGTLDYVSKARARHQALWAGTAPRSQYFSQALAEYPIQ